MADNNIHTIQARLIQATKTRQEWEQNYSDYIPEKGEMVIITEAESNAQGMQIRVGDGEHSVLELTPVDTAASFGTAVGATEVNRRVPGGRSKWTPVKGQKAYEHGNGSDPISYEASGERSTMMGSGATAAGIRSVAAGTRTVASAENSFAIGSVTYARGNGSFVAGNNTYTGPDATYALAQGNSTEALGEASHAEGSNTKATQTGAHSEGQSTEANGRYSHAEGKSTETTAAGEYAHAEGDTTSAKAQAAHAEGYKTTAEGIYSHSEGQSTIATGKSSHAEGADTWTQGDFSHAEGQGTVTTHTVAQHVQGRFNIVDDDESYLHIVGNGTSSANRSNAHTIDEQGNAWFSGNVYIGGTGQNDAQANRLITAADVEINMEKGSGKTSTQQAPRADKVTIASNETTPHFNFTGLAAANLSGRMEFGAVGDYSATMNGRSAALSKHAFAINNSTVAMGEESFAQGYETIAQGNSSVATGTQTWAQGVASHTEGERTHAQGDDSHAEGALTKAIGRYSHAEGWTTKAEEENSHAEGMLTTASGHSSHAEGNNTVAEGTNAHAEGYNSQAIGEQSHAEGNTTFANGNVSHTEGLSTIARGTNSHTEGCLTKTFENAAHSHAEGYRTYTTTNGAHSEGNGAFTGSDQSESDLSDTSKTALESENLGLLQEAWLINKDFTLAAGAGAHAEGAVTWAQGAGAHSEGAFTMAIGNYSHAGGYHTKATKDCQTAIGAFNKQEDTAKFIVGSGILGNEKNCFSTGVNDAGTAYIKIGNTEITESQLQRLLALLPPLAPTFILTIDGVDNTFDLREGMTWKEWIESDYNTIGVFNESGTMVYTYNLQPIIDSSNNYVASSDKIITGARYSHE